MNQVVRKVEGEHLLADEDAAVIGQLYAAARKSQVDSVRYLIECGSKLIEKKNSMEHGSWLPWLSANGEVLGFASRQTASRLMKLASKEDGALTHHLDEAKALEISRELWGNDSTGSKHISDDSYEWYTPPEYLLAARSVMDEIDLDPASSEEAQKIVKASNFYSKETDGLQHHWKGRVWLNPPYCMPQVAQFVEKALEHYSAGDVEEAIVLVNNATDTDWFQNIMHFGPVCFTDGRIHFYSNGKQKLQTRQGQAFFYLGLRHKKFAEVFKAFGTVLVLHDEYQE